MENYSKEKTPPKAVTIDIFIHSDRLWSLDRENVTYEIIEEPNAMVGVVKVRIPVDTSNIMYLFFAGVRFGRNPIANNSRRAA